MNMLWGTYSSEPERYGEREAWYQFIYKRLWFENIVLLSAVQCREGERDRKPYHSLVFSILLYLSLFA